MIEPLKLKYCQSCGSDQPRYARGGKCIACQKARTASTYIKKTGGVVIAKPDSGYHKPVNRNYGGGRPDKEERNKSLVNDINLGMDINLAVTKYGITRQYILIVLKNKKRAEAGIVDSKAPYTGLYAFRDAIILQFSAQLGGITRRHTGA